MDKLQQELSMANMELDQQVHDNRERQAMLDDKVHSLNAQTAKLLATEDEFQNVSEHAPPLLASLNVSSLPMIPQNLQCLG